MDFEDQIRRTACRHAVLVFDETDLWGSFGRAIINEIPAA